jgi:MFS family permease
MPLNSTMIAVAVPDIAAEVDAPPGTVTQALVATYLVAAIALQSPGGKLGDRIGQWRAFGFGQVLLALGAIAGFLAPTLWLLTASRVLMAAGGAIVVPATVALLRTELPEHRRGRAFGIFGSVMSLAAGIGPLVGGELVGWFGWPSIFLVNLPILVLSAALAASAHHEPTPRRPTRFDWAGSVLLAGALVCLVLAAEEGDHVARALHAVDRLLAHLLGSGGVLAPGHRHEGPRHALGAALVVAERRQPALARVGHVGERRLDARVLHRRAAGEIDAGGDAGAEEVRHRLAAHARAEAAYALGIDPR